MAADSVDVADAEAAIRRLNTTAVALANTEALARLLLRAESVASSYIEGLAVGGRRLLRAEAARAFGDAPGDVTAEGFLGNIEAMTWAVDKVSAAPAVTVDGLLEVHRRLLAGTRLADHAGRVRTDQNWIGGSSFNPCSAAFVPPPPEHVPDLLADLCSFSSGDGLPAVAQAAIAHAQFETTTATAGRGAHSSTSSSGAAGWRRTCCHRSRLCWRRPRPRAIRFRRRATAPGVAGRSCRFRGRGRLIGRSFQATNEAMRRLETAGVVSQVTVGRRNRAYEARAIIDAFTALERQLSSPAGETRAAPPSGRRQRRPGATRRS